MATASETIEQMKLELRAKTEARRLKVGQEREGAKFGFNPQWRSAAQESFSFTYGKAVDQGEVDRSWAAITAVKRTVAKLPGDKDLQSKDLSPSSTASKAVSKSSRKVVCESELRRGGSTSIKRFAARVADLNGKTETLAIGTRFNGSVPGANAVLNLKF